MLAGLHRLDLAVMSNTQWEACELEAYSQLMHTTLAMQSRLRAVRLCFAGLPCHPKQAAL